MMRLLGLWVSRALGQLPVYVYSSSNAGDSLTLLLSKEKLAPCASPLSITDKTRNQPPFDYYVLIQRDHLRVTLRLVSLCHQNASYMTTGVSHFNISLI